MSKYAINPNALPDPAVEERAALARDHAFSEEDEVGGGCDSAPAGKHQPLPPMMSPLPDPRFPHGVVDEVEQRLAEIKAAKRKDVEKQDAAAVAPVVDKPQAPSPAKTAMSSGALSHPLVLSLMATLPEPGAVWSAKDRADWLLAAEGIFHLVYKADARLNVEADAA